MAKIKRHFRTIIKGSNTTANDKNENQMKRKLFVMFDVRTF